MNEHETTTISSVKAIEKYKIYVAFKDRTEGIYDLSHLAGRGVFKAWEDGANFYQVSINPESGAITWPGELDIDTIAVYCALKNIAVDEYLNLTGEHASY
ncbi:MAG: DUF2442 domain-containing protein [Segetibacter sp.]